MIDRGEVNYGIDLESPAEEAPSAYTDSELVAMLDAQRKSNGESVAVFTDIDDTAFLPSEPETTKILFDGAKRENYPIIADTGNQIQVVGERIAKGELPYFQAICSSVGSQIWVLKREGDKLFYVPDSKYRERVLATGFNRKEVVETAKEEIDGESASDQELKLQFQWPAEEQAFLDGAPYLENQEFKVSLQFEGNIQKMQSVRDRFTELFPKFRVSVCQIQKLDGGKSLYYVDLLALDKADAINYLVEELDIDSGIVAGDSGNDIPMFENSIDKVAKVKVGGSKPELDEAIDDIVNKEDVTGAGSFKYVPTNQGEHALFYVEKKGRKGPHSVAYAAEVLRRAREINKIRNNTTSTENK
ncbi:MAG: HAD family hydrolase [Patescibacteria group bacterium]|jgi:hydroxymethylpyrimidine pyrophosphatase-like HAD family hydrolase